MTDRGAPTVIRTVAEMRAAVAGWREQGRSVALTPTLGALHAGHSAHLERAARLADVRVVSIFLNPTQFSATEDLDRYPHTVEADLALAGASNATAAFVPTVDEMYPAGSSGVHVSAGPVGLTFEGASRPGHFDGVLTVVAKLLGIITPDVVTFGAKDAQQLFLVRRMIADLDFAARIESISIVRDADGLALSSRNRFLKEEDRRAAAVIPRALDAAEASVREGVNGALAAAERALRTERAVRLDYLSLVDPVTFEAVGDDFHGVALCLAAARVGGTRLIDNRELRIP